MWELRGYSWSKTQGDVEKSCFLWRKYYVFLNQALNCFSFQVYCVYLYLTSNMQTSSLLHRWPASIIKLCKDAYGWIRTSTCWHKPTVHQEESIFHELKDDGNTTHSIHHASKMFLNWIKPSVQYYAPGKNQCCVQVPVFLQISFATPHGLRHEQSIIIFSHY